METMRQSPPILISKPVVTEEDALLGMVNNKLLSDFYILVESNQSAAQLDHDHSQCCDDHIIYAHQFVLGIHNEYFMSLFRGEFFKERKCFHINCTDELTWGAQWSVDEFKQVFVHLLRYIYSGLHGLKNVKLSTAHFILLCRMVNFFRATTRLNQSFQAFIAKWLNEAELTEGYFEVLRCLKQLSLIETVDAVLEDIFRTKLREAIKRQVWGKLFPFVRSTSLTFEGRVMKHFVFEDFLFYYSIVKCMHTSSKFLNKYLRNAFDELMSELYSQVKSVESEANEESRRVIVREQIRNLIKCIVTSAKELQESSAPPAPVRAKEPNSPRGKAEVPTDMQLREAVKFLLCLLGVIENRDQLRGLLTDCKVNQYWDKLYPFDSYGSSRSSKLVIKDLDLYQLLGEAAH
jgi:hypothetical protein